MNVHHIYKLCIVIALAALGTNFGLDKAIYAQPVSADAEAGVQVLTRGPVHEAFAETVTYDPEPGIVAPKAPPAAIEEVPPEQKPSGDNVAWIPGYWGWDDERSNFLWVSGIWRALPPGRQWVPGYWGKFAQGFQWTSGYWADAKLSEVQYLPEPPATVEAGPNIAAPSADDIWQPGCWVWQNSRYAWRPGFWATAQPDWVWVPPHYVWSPRGYVFVDGYNDYAIARRGVLFAPVYFDADVYGRRGFSYSPATVIDLAALTSHLFVRPQYQHYYFGDYYAANYQDAGFYSSYSYNSSRFGYDPIYAHTRWQHRQDGEWEHRVAADFQNRRDHEDARPPRTWAAQRALGASGVSSGFVAAPLTQLTKSQGTPLRFQPVDQLERQKLAQHAQELQRFRDERQNLEINAAGAPSETRTKQFEPARVKLPGSPIVGRSADQLGKDQAPPKIYNAPKPDLKVEPKPRVHLSAGQPQERKVQLGTPQVNRTPLDQPQPQPKVQRSAPPTQVNQPATQTHVNPAADKQSGGQNKDKSNDKEKDKGKDK
ncbi:MAG: YXWGXW repeat-containing protein [Thermoguttaceae bacterium]|jgi:hypothetical protein